VQNQRIRGKYVFAALGGRQVLVVSGVSAFPQDPSGNPMLTAECIGAPWSAAKSIFESPKTQNRKE
jgi:hypothetical protein